MLHVVAGKHKSSVREPQFQAGSSIKTQETKNAFLAVCLLIDPTCNLTEINESAPYGGLIGPGNSILHNYCKNSKLLRVHAIFHDAYGFMRTYYNIGPGYV